MKKADAIQWAGGVNALAAIFDSPETGDHITKSAVSQWGEELPKPRVYELRIKRPHWFNKDGTPKAPPVPADADRRA